MLSVWLKKIRNSLGLLSLGLFVNCDAKSLELMADKYSFFDGIEVFKVNQITDEDNIVWVDVRPLEERQIAIIEGILTEQDFLAHHQDSNYRDAKFVAYCTIGHRSGKFAQKMLKKGITVGNLYGGILAWVNGGRLVVDQEGKETRSVHVYGSTWNFLPEGYQAVY